jgi:hypothetical protein
MSHTPVAFLLTNHKAVTHSGKPHTFACIDQRNAHSRSLLRGQQIFPGYLSTGLDELNRRR